jgi:uncharacterized protein involved in outer membrane biogenesis
MELAWDLLALLKGQVNVEKLILDQADLKITPLQSANLRTQKTESSQTEAQVKAESDFFRLKQIKELKIDNLSLQTKYPQTNKTLKLVIKTLTGAIPENQPGWIDLKGEYEKEGFSLRAKVGPPARKPQNKSYLPFSLSYKAKAGEVKAAGKFWEEPQTQLELGISFYNLDLGKLITRLNLGKNFEARVKQVDLKTLVRGFSLSEIAARSSLEMNFKQVDILFQEPAQKTVIAFEAPVGSLSIQPGKPVALALSSKINKQPVSLKAKTDVLTKLLSQKTSPPLMLALIQGENTLELKAHKPGQGRDIELTLKGKNLKSLESLTGKRLPGIGPYHLSGTLKILPKGYGIDNLRIRLAKSDLRGYLGLDLTGKKPNLLIKLSSDYLQLKDLAGLDSPQDDKSAKNKNQQGPARPWFLFSPEFMKALNFDLKLKAKQVLAGPNAWGGGVMNLSLQNQKLALNPLHLDLPGGLVRLNGQFARQGKISVGFFIDIERLDYGSIAQMLAPEKNYQGVVTLKANLHSKAQDEQNLLKRAHGKFDFAVWPQGIETGFIDLWAVNLVTAIFNQFQKNKARLNCLVCRLKMENGRATQEAIILDTSQMRVKGKAEVDFNTEKIWVRLKPTPKQAQFFSLATPIEVKGNFKEFKAGIPAGGILTTATKLITDLAIVPLQMLFQKSVPLDGHDVCTDPLK